MRFVWLRQTAGRNRIANKTNSVGVRQAVPFGSRVVLFFRTDVLVKGKGTAFRAPTMAWTRIIGRLEWRWIFRWMRPWSDAALSETRRPYLCRPGRVLLFERGGSAHSSPSDYSSATGRRDRIVACQYLACARKWKRPRLRI